MDKKIVVLICAVIVGAILGAYILANTQTTPTSKIKKQSETFTDLAGRQVTLKVPVEKIILDRSGGSGTFHILVVLLGKDVSKKVVGIDPTLRTSRHDFWEMYVSVMPELKNIPEIGTISKGTFNIEKVVSLKPDVLIAPLWMQETAEDVVRKLEDAGIQTIYISFEDPEDAVKSITLLGGILGEEKRAKELVDFYTKQIEEIKSRLETIDRLKPKVYVEGGFKGTSEYGNTYGKPDSGWGAVIVQAGGINIAEGKVERWGPINPEYLLEENPDVIFITGAYWPSRPDSLRLGYNVTPEQAKEQLRRFTKRPGWETLNAVKNSKVCGIYHGFAWDIFGFAARQFMAKVLYPEEFRDLDPEKNLRIFFEKFLQMPYEGTWMECVEG